MKKVDLAAMDRAELEQFAYRTSVENDELKMRRAKQLVLREVNRASLNYQFANMRDNVSQNGVRGLLFSDNAITGLKKADYAFLGYKALTLLIKLYTRRRRN